MSARRILSNFAALGSGEALGRIVAFFTTLYLARVLGADGYGVISFAAGVNLYLTKIADFQIETIGTREVANDENSVRTKAPAILLCRLLLAVVLIVASAGVVRTFVPDPDRTVLLLYLLTLIPIALNTKWIHVGLESSRPVGVSRLLSEVVVLGLVYVSVHSFDDVNAVPIAAVAGETVAAILLITTVVRRMSWTFDFASARSAFAAAIPLVGQVLLGILIFNSDLLFLRALTTLQTVGFYAAAYTLVSFLLNVGVMYGLALLPALTKSEDPGGLYRHALFQVSVATFPIAVGGVLVAHDLIDIAFGADFAPSAVALQILICSVPLSLFRNVAWAALVARDEQRRTLHSTAIATVVNLVLNTALIPTYGMRGAAFATLITELVRTALLVVFVGHALPWKRLLPPLVAATAMAATLVAFSLPGLVAIPVGAVVYGVVLLALLRLI